MELTSRKRPRRRGPSAAAGAAPLFEGESPEGGEDDDAGHVEGPAGEVVLAHLGLAHGVEEELEVPDDAGQCGEDVVADEGLGARGGRRWRGRVGRSRPGSCLRRGRRAWG